MSDYITLRNAFNNISTDTNLKDRVLLSNNQENKLETSDYHTVVDLTNMNKAQEEYIEQNIKIGCEIHKALTDEFGTAGTALFKQYCGNSMLGQEITYSDMKKLFSEAQSLEKASVNNSIHESSNDFSRKTFIENKGQENVIAPNEVINNEQRLNDISKNLVDDVLNNVLSEIRSEEHQTESSFKDISAQCRSIVNDKKETSAELQLQNKEINDLISSIDSLMGEESITEDFYSALVSYKLELREKQFENNNLISKLDTKETSENKEQIAISGNENEVASKFVDDIFSSALNNVANEAKDSMNDVSKNLVSNILNDALSELDAEAEQIESAFNDITAQCRSIVNDKKETAAELQLQNKEINDLISSIDSLMWEDSLTEEFNSAYNIL